MMRYFRLLTQRRPAAPPSYTAKRREIRRHFEEATRLARVAYRDQPYQLSVSLQQCHVAYWHALRVAAQTHDALKLIGDT